jgi:hypothetical protein
MNSLFGAPCAWRLAAAITDVPPASARNNTTFFAFVLFAFAFALFALAFPLASFALALAPFAFAFALFALLTSAARFCVCICAGATETETDITKIRTKEDFRIAKP